MGAVITMTGKYVGSGDWDAGGSMWWLGSGLSIWCLGSGRFSMVIEKWAWFSLVVVKYAA